MKAKDIQKAGVQSGPLVKLALSLMGPATKAGLKKKQITGRLQNLVAAPDAFLDDPHFGALAKALLEQRAAESSPAFAPYGELESDAPWRMWGSDIDPAAIEQMQNACRLPVAVQGALMPDAHVGYGLPIGGVLAVDNAVIPYAVGVDIACRMMLTVIDMPVNSLERHRDELIRVLESQTLFGAGRDLLPHDHPVMHEDWDFCQAVAKTKSKA